MANTRSKEIIFKCVIFDMVTILEQLRLALVGESWNQDSLAHSGTAETHSYWNFLELRLTFTAGF